MWNYCPSHLIRPLFRDRSYSWRCDELLTGRVSPQKLGMAHRCEHSDGRQVITPVAPHPTIFREIGMIMRPITLGRLVRTIIIVMTGTATRPLMTADQNSAVLGSIAAKFSAPPITVAKMIVV